MTTQSTHGPVDFNVIQIGYGPVSKASVLIAT
jgi:hypothetical protein